MQELTLTYVDEEGNVITPVKRVTAAETGDPGWLRVETLFKECFGCVPKKTPHVYLVSFKDGMVKVGVSADPEKRLDIIEGQSGRRITASFISKPRKDAYAIEAAFKRCFARQRENGECFALSFDTAREFIRKALKENKPPPNHDQAGPNENGKEGERDERTA